jgi:hypothetical protein
MLRLVIKLFKKFGDELSSYWYPIIRFLKLNWEVTLLVIVVLFVMYVFYKKNILSKNNKK